MALLSQLEYYGIRSVPGNSKDSHHIEFESPLTIISGPNGSGKTTLIEALKFVTTNEGPPGDKQAFVHNLTISRSSRVDGLVRLEFLTDKGKKVTVTKRFNIVKNARTKGGMQFKSDESTINVFDNSGNQKSISSKSADFQTEVLNHLGVPAAILSNVIFCHQEDSCWPLSEPRELKLRFDKIFQLQKFTKAIEQAKKIKKAEMQKFKVLDAESKHAKLQLQNKGKTLKDKEDSKATQTQIAEHLQELDNSIKEYTGVIQKMGIELKQIERKKIRRDQVNAELAVFANVVKQSEKQGVVPYNGTIDELNEEIRVAQERLKSEEGSNSMQGLDEIQRTLDRKQMDKKQCQQMFNEVTRKKENYEDEFAKFTKMEDEILQHFPHLKGNNISEQLTPFYLERNRLLNEAKVIHQEARADYQRKCEEAVAKRSRAQADLQFISENNAKLLGEISLIEQKCAAIDGSNEQETKINRRLTELKLMLRGLPQNDEDPSQSFQMKRLLLRKEIEELRNQSLKSAEYEDRVKEKKRIASEIDVARMKYDDLLNKHREDITIIFNKMPDGKWRNKFQNKKDEITIQLKETNESLTKKEFSLRNEISVYDEKSREEDQLLAQLVNLKRSIVNECKCDIEHLKEEADNVSKQLRRARKELAPLSTKSDLYDVWINETTTKNCCPLCERKFTGKGGAQPFVDKLNNMTLSLPDDIARLTKEVSQLELRDKALSTGLIDAKKLRELEKSLEECRKRKDRAEVLRNQYELELLQIKGENDKWKQLFEGISRIMADISLIDNLLLTLDNLNGQLSSLPTIDEAAMSSETLRFKISEKEKSLRDVENEIDELEAMKKNKNDIEAEAIQLRSKLVELSEFSGQKSHFLEQLRAMKSDLEELNRKKKIIADELPRLEETIHENNRNRDHCEQDMAQRERAGENELREIKDYQRSFENLKIRMQQLFVPQEHFDDLNKKMRQLEAEFNDCILRKGQLESNSSYYKELMERKRYLERQLDLFATIERMKLLEGEIDELALPENAQVEELTKEYQTLLTKKNKAEIKKSNLEGQLTEVQRKLNETRTTLKKDEMKNAEINFRNSLVQKAVCEKIIEDLESFVTVLDTSILKFHKDKMAAINVILDDLWRRVYNGVDIETIKIKTEKNESADKRASYDYNVMMVLEGGVEVGMRDRCSAGQKMLASLLIRIALADVFAKTCSIIALDEPTTNLDTSKIEQMAAMLNTLINTRRADDKYGNIHGKQFQMIVITHDDRLVDALKLGCRPNKTFRISKDALSGKSRLDTYDYAGNKIL